MIAISSGYADAQIDECLDAMVDEWRGWAG
jgi:hypothetical protein